MAVPLIFKTSYWSVKCKSGLSALNHFAIQAGARIRDSLVTISKCDKLLQAELLMGKNLGTLTHHPRGLPSCFSQVAVF